MTYTFVDKVEVHLFKKINYGHKEVKVMLTVDELNRFQSIYELCFGETSRLEAEESAIKLVNLMRNISHHLPFDSVWFDGYRANCN